MPLGHDQHLRARLLENEGDLAHAVDVHDRHQHRAAHQHRLIRNRTLDTIGQLYRDSFAAAYPKMLQRRRQCHGPVADFADCQIAYRIARDESQWHAAVFGRPGLEGVQAGVVRIPTVAIPLVALVGRHQTENTVGYEDSWCSWRFRIRPDNSTAFNET